MALMVYQILLKSMHEKIVCAPVLSASAFCAKKKKKKNSLKKTTNKIHKISGMCI